MIARSFALGHDVYGFKKAGYYYEPKPPMVKFIIKL
jgi:hypothetical protein